MDSNLIRFAVALFASYPLSLLYISLFPLREKPCSEQLQLIKSLYCGVIGLSMGYYVYGWPCVFHVSLAMLYSYILGQYQHRRVPILIFGLSILHLSYCHLRRQIFNPNNSIDLTGPMMIVTIKVSSFAWNVFDGWNKEDKQAVQDGSRYSIVQYPSLAEYFGFIFFFPTFLCGPSIEFNDFLISIKGLSVPGVQMIKTQHVVVPAMMRLLYGVFFTIYHLVLSQLFPPSVYQSAEFLAFSLNPIVLIQRIFFIYMCLQGFKAKFYCVWLISEGACIAMGCGAKVRSDKSLYFRYLDSKIGDVIIDWGGLSNVAPLAIETATSFQQLTRMWNARTHHWLKHYVYIRIIQAASPKAVPIDSKDVKVGEDGIAVVSKSVQQKVSHRVQSMATYGVFVISALWHGFYSGYYLTFVSGALLTSVERKLRKLYFQFREGFELQDEPSQQGNGGVKQQDSMTAALKLQFYDQIWNIMGWIASQIMLSYCTIPFITLYLRESMASWRAVFFFGHVGIIVCRLLSALLLKPKKRNIKEE
ncbi:hypothetical protein MIR68_007975 [Amoeboaphelidium protococcarum]|nr:hypothetical protein MIR68_007975 [Amoeboaphelidium protococcarum]